MDEQDYNGGAGEFHVRLLSYTCLPGVIITLFLLHLVWKKKNCCGLEERKKALHKYGKIVTVFLLLHQ